MSIVKVFEQDDQYLVVDALARHNKLRFQSVFLLKSAKRSSKKVANRPFFHYFPLIASLSRQIFVF